MRFWKHKSLRISVNGKQSSVLLLQNLLFWFVLHYQKTCNTPWLCLNLSLVGVDTKSQDQRRWKNYSFISLTLMLWRFLDSLIFKLCRVEVLTNSPRR